MVIIVFGPSGVGKTTVGRHLAETLGWRFLDADDFHGVENRDKMSRGVPLTDADRHGWLVRLEEAVHQAAVRDEDLVLACSALRKAYRRRLTVDGTVRWVYLKAALGLVKDRLGSRRGHFASPAIADSQFADFEEPDLSENVTEVEADKPVAEIVREIIDRLGLKATPGASATRDNPPVNTVTMSELSPVTVRQFRPEDQAQVEWLFSRTPDAGQVSLRQRAIPPDIADIGGHYVSFWVALETLYGEEAMVGITGVVELGASFGIEEPDFVDRARRSARLHRVMVAPERWHSGVGSALLRAVIASCLASSYESVILETSTRQEAALRFYEKLGFAVIGRSSWREYTLVWHELDLKQVRGQSG